jgi:hypothetical protein
MKDLWKHLPSPAIVLASAALLVALGGTSYAAMTLPAKSVGTKQLKNNAVTSLKVKNHSLLKADFKAGQLPAGATGATGPTGAAGATGPAGPFPDALPTGKTIRGAYNMGGTAAAANALATASVSFVFPLTTAPTVKIVLQGAAAPSECPGNATSPQAQPGFLCIYEEGSLNSSPGALLNSVETSGATIFTNSTAAGRFYSVGSWAVTAS